MGAVYEVIHTETERRRALKVMHPYIVERDELRARFKQEARIAASVESEHIVDVSDAGFDEKTSMPFLVMELLRGEELGRCLERVKRFAPDDVLLYLHQTSLALDKTHKARIVHRDLKPENLFLCERDEGPPRIKILDFGIAKIIADGATKANATRSIGTPMYMAPEQFRPGSAISPATDIFALGMIAYTLLVGAPYWQEEQSTSGSIYAFLLEAVEGPKEPATKRAAKLGVFLPPAFDSWFAMATARSPADRFPTASGAVQALADALGRPRPGYGASGATASGIRLSMSSAPRIGAADGSGFKGPQGTSVMSDQMFARSDNVPELGLVNSATPPPPSTMPRSGSTLVSTSVTSSQNPVRRPSLGVVAAIALPVLLLGSGAVYYLVVGSGKTAEDAKRGRDAAASSAMATAATPTNVPQVEPVAPTAEGVTPSASASVSASGQPETKVTGTQRAGAGTTSKSTTTTNPTKTTKTKAPSDDWGR